MKLKQNTQANDLQIVPANFRVPRPLLWLAIAVVAVYFPTLSMGITDLDDGIIINGQKEYYEHLGNLITSFFRSAFGTATDILYRPVSAGVMLLNYQISNHGQNMMSYHLINILCHLVAVLLLYQLFLRLHVRQFHAFLLVLLFAVHPALSQAVAWIPARNETLLAIFVFSFLIFTIDYTLRGKIKNLILSVIFLLLALFTKETAVVAAPVAVVLVVLVLHRSVVENRLLIQYALWVICLLAWLGMRSVAITHPALQPSEVVGDFVHRLPLTIQYLGKMLLPFNLSVFPSQEDTVYYYGLAATVILATAIFLCKGGDWRNTSAGILVFFLFMIPVLCLPRSITEQTFEYRMYLPLAGVLLILPETIILQNKLAPKKLMFAAIAVIVLFAGINWRHQQAFSDPLSFWTAAVETTPHSAEANMRLAARVGDEEKAKQLFLTAFVLNPKQPHLNLAYGVMLQDKDSLLASEKYLLAEKKITDCDQCDMLLARVALIKKDTASAIAYLQSYLAQDSLDQAANNNLLLLFLDSDQDDKAKAHAKHMIQLGLDVDAAVRRHFQL